MIGFDEILELMERQKDPLMDSGEDQRAMSVVRSGNTLSHSEFWEDFMMLCGDAEGMAQLLGVRPDQVRTWSSRIRDAKDHVRKLDSSGEESPEEHDEILPTGDNGALMASKMGAKPFA